MKALHKKWIQQWAAATEKLEQQRAIELASLTDERARQISEWILSEYNRLVEHTPAYSGLVEQQKYFMRWRG